MNTPITMTWSEARHYLHVNFFLPHQSLICDQGHAMFTKTISIFTSEWHQIIGHELWSIRRSSESSFWFRSGLWDIFVIVPTQANISKLCQGNIMASKYSGPHMNVKWQGHSLEWRVSGPHPGNPLCPGQEEQFDLWSDLDMYTVYTL